MNIFFLHRDPFLCAQYHCDKHVMKMLVETAQMLCGAHWEQGVEAPYRRTHPNHPCSVWARSSIANYRWLVQFGQSLAFQYTSRYHKLHKTGKIMEWLEANEPDLPDLPFTPPPQCMDGKYRLGGENPSVEDTVEAYRNYYVAEKSRFANWRNEVPSWYVERVEAENNSRKDAVTEAG